MNSKIFDPINYMRIGKRYLVRGTAWSGTIPVEKVEVAIFPDGTAESELVWREAQLFPPNTITSADRPPYDRRGRKGEGFR